MTILLSISALLQCTILFSAVLSTQAGAWYGVRGKTNENNGFIVENRQLQTNTTTFKLINAVTDTSITDLIQNSVVNLGSISPNTLSIQVVLTGWQAGSVRITLTGAISRIVLERGTFSLCGNSGSDFFPCTGLKHGSYSILAELFLQRNGTGLMSSRRIDFVLQGGSPIAPVPTPVAKAPTKSPDSFPTKAPTRSPTKMPSKAPTRTPITNAPLAKAPTRSPTASPVSSPSCTIPQVSHLGLFLLHKQLPSKQNTDNNFYFIFKNPACRKLVKLGKISYPCC
jgi:cell division septation protein DedD